MRSAARAAGILKSATMLGSNPPGGPTTGPCRPGRTPAPSRQFPSTRTAALPPRVTNSSRPASEGIATRVKPPFSVWPVVTPPPPNGPASAVVTVVVQR